MIFVSFSNLLYIISSILFSSELYPLVQKIIKIIIKRARIINNKKNPAFDSIFSLDANTLQDVIPKFENSDLLFISPKFLYKFYLYNYNNSSLLIFILENELVDSITSQEQLALSI